MTTINRIEIPTPFVLNRVNCYYIHDSTPTLIDAGVDTEEAFQRLKEGVANASGTLENIKRIILTHAHADHIGMLSEVVKLSGATVLIHKHDAPKMKDSGEKGASALKSRYREFFIESGAPQDLTDQFLEVLLKRLKRYFKPFEEAVSLSGSEIFSFDDFQLEVVNAPGHSPGSICVFNRHDGTLFSGDTLLEKITSNPVVEVNPTREIEGYRSLENYKKTLLALAELPVETVMPGHGKPFRNHRGRINQLLDHHEDRMSQILDTLTSNRSRSGSLQGMTRYMIAQQLFFDLQGMDVFLGLSEMKGHLEILEAQGRVVSLLEEGRMVYCIPN